MFTSGVLSRLHFIRAIVRFLHPVYPSLRREVCGLSFNGPIGLGPGLDRKGELYNVFTDYGFSYVNVGPIDRTSVKHAIDHVRAYPVDKDTILSICINKDHLDVFSLAYDFFDMFVIEIPGNDYEDILEQILDIRLAYDKSKPVFLRITRDHSDQEFGSIVHYCLMNGVDGFVVAKKENVRKIHDLTSGRIPIIGYGGIRSTQAALEMLESGANLIEITSGLVLDGSGLVHRILKDMDKLKQTKSDAE